VVVNVLGFDDQPIERSLNPVPVTGQTAAGWGYLSGREKVSERSEFFSQKKGTPASLLSPHAQTQGERTTKN
jgi:hypothetical protein